MRALIPLICLLPFSAMAAGSDNSVEPEPSETTTSCEEGLIFDLATQTCMTPEDSTNEDSAMMNSVRELAHFGRYADALTVLDLMPDQNADLVLTYRGFVSRKMGDIESGMAHYAKALALNPDNHLARSYQGQAYVETGELALAAAALTEIRMRGGRGTWAEASLADALATGRTYSF